MIIEIADFTVRAEERDAFAAALTQAAATVLARADGYRGHQILACQESPGRFVLSVQWDTVEAHTVGFRQSPAFAEWRALIGPFFQQPPHVAHFDVVATA
ncbi:MAG: antibiotic biosynthesis monooxygenase [Hydrogenophaga sp.]|jgi:heme-degrading monooxygenase HmoA|nr:antibiotic biosynthesis monooxygenase [Hydrogenophaga sp.]